MLLRVHRLADAEAVSREAARLFLESAEASVGRFSVALSGGSTPLATYRRLGRPPLLGQVDWARVHLFWGDERCLPPEDERSNSGAALAALGEAARAAGLHPIPAQRGPEVGAELYEEELRAAQGGAPMDLVLLGLGADGHTASLFPGSPALEVTGRAVVGVAPPQHLEPRVARVTLTLEAINAARRVVFLVTGASKAEILARVLSGDEASATALPAARVRPEGELIWLVDRAAAARL